MKVRLVSSVVHMWRITDASITLLKATPLTKAALRLFNNYFFGVVIFYPKKEIDDLQYILLISRTPILKLSTLIYFFLGKSEIKQT